MRAVRNNARTGAPVADVRQTVVANWLLPSTFGGTRYRHRFTEVSELPSISTMRNGAAGQLADFHRPSLHQTFTRSCPAVSCEKLHRQDASVKDFSIGKWMDNQ